MMSYTTFKQLEIPGNLINKEFYMKKHIINVFMLLFVFFLIQCSNQMQLPLEQETVKVSNELTIDEIIALEAISKSGWSLDKEARISSNLNNLN